MSGRSTAICTSIWIIILATVYLAFSVLGFMAYNCDVDMAQGNIVDKILHLVYFSSSECPSDFDISELKDLGLETDDVNFTVTFSSTAAKRTHDWMFIYIILSSVWIATSIFLLGSAICNSNGFLTYLFLAPWVLTTLANFVTDIVATIIYLNDLKDTMTFRGLLDFLDAEFDFGDIDTGDVTIPPGSIDEIIDQFKNTEVPFTWTPSALMLVFFSRLGVIWILNLILLIVVIVEAVRNNKIKPTAPDWIRNRSLSIDERFEPNDNRMARPPLNQNNNFNNQYITSRPMTIDTLNNKPDIVQGKVSPYSSSPPQNSWLARKNKEDIEDKPSNLRREFENRMNNAPIIKNEELRSQLPWSYTQDRNDQPKRAPARQNHLDLGPPVPVPDYTLHFPKRNTDRGNVRSVTPPDVRPPSYKGTDYRNIDNSYYY